MATLVAMYVERCPWRLHGTARVGAREGGNQPDALEPPFFNCSGQYVGMSAKAELKQTRIYCDRQLRKSWWPDRLAKEWMLQYPGLFDFDDFRQATNQPEKHFYEWFVAIHLFVPGRFPLRGFGHQKYAPLAVIPDST